MTYLNNNITTVRGKHRLHPYLETLLVYVASFALAYRWLTKQSIPWQPGAFASFDCNLFPRRLTLPIVGPVECALTNNKVEQIEIGLIPATPRPPGPRADISTNLHSLQASIFIQFFEDHRPWVEANIGKVRQWPPIFSFARVMRNAMAHGGNVYWQDKKAMPVQWHSLRYSIEDHGRRIFGKDLAFGDVMILLLEMSDELDRAGCPVEPNVEA